MNQYEFFNTLLSYGKLRDILLFDIFSCFAVLYLKMAKSIDQIHDSSFFSYQFIEMSLMITSIQSLDTNTVFPLFSPWGAYLISNVFEVG